MPASSLSTSFQLAMLGHPIFQAFALIVVAVTYLCFRRYRTAATFALVAFSWTLLCSTPAFTKFLQQGLEADYRQMAATTYPTADAIVVLGGEAPMPAYEDSSIESQEAGTTRVGFGFQLFRAARAPTILLTGGDGSATGMARELTLRGIPVSALELESRSMTTHEDAIFSAAILKREHRNRILLVTSAWAMARAEACFRKQGLEVIPAPALETKHMLLASVPWWPRYAALQQSGRYLHEYIGFWEYRLFGWA